MIIDERNPSLARCALWILPIAIACSATVRAQRLDLPLEARPEFAPLRAEPPRPLPFSGPDLFEAGVNVHDLGPVAPPRIAEADAKRELRYGHVAPGPKRVGIVRELGLPFDAGSWRASAIDEANTLWTTCIRSPGAHGMRLHLTDFDIGRSQTIIYGEVGQPPISRGPFTGRGPEGDGDFWTASLPGEVLYIEILGPDEPQLRIPEIVHYDRDPAPVAPTGGDEGGVAGGALSCHLDVTCHAVNEAVRQATGRMRYVEDGSTYSCTGTLIVDTDPTTTVPYFLTAYHCVSEQSVVNTLEVFWFYETPSCGGSPPPLNDDLPHNCGGTLLETSETIFGNDMALIRLHGPLPSGIGMAGWTTASLDDGYGIHHPAGSWKRVSFLDDSSGACLSALQYDYYELTSGAIEGGSSGSGIFNGLGQLSGQLYGWCGVLEDPPCSEQQDSSLQYGEFEETLEDTAYWLVDIGGTIHVDAANASPGDGTAGDPFPTVSAGYAFAWDGTRLVITGGDYAETLTFTKKMTLVSDGGIVTIGGP